MLPSTEPLESIDIGRHIAALSAWWRAVTPKDAGTKQRLRDELALLRATWRRAAQRFDEQAIAILRLLAREVELETGRPLDDAPAAVLRDVFGYDRFRPGQRELIAAALAGQDALGVMPTGAGKSLTYQVPARVLGGTTLVISPLVSLMKDQVDAACAVGLRATFMNSTLAPDVRRERVAALRSGQFELVYAAPEGIEAWLGSVLDRVRLSLIAVDEAHCISHWGHEFRPSYRNLQGLKRRFGDVPVLALTATATAEVARDIVDQLGMCAPILVRGSLFRSNLELHAFRKGDGASGVRQRLLGIALGRPGDSGIIYCLSRKSAESTAEYLCTQGVRAAAYHAGMDAGARTAVQDDFQRDDVDVVVATVAFGMGIDKSNIRYVIHRDMPRSIEGYYQEVGRAGRDGLPSVCVLFYSWADVLAYDRMAAEASDEALAQRQRTQVREMFALADKRTCRHQAVARHLGETLDACGRACDVCTGVDLLASPTAAPGRGRKRATALSSSVAAPMAADDALFHALKRLRKDLADRKGVPAYIVFSDATLRAMAAHRPRSLAEMLAMPGVGPKKLAEFGARFLERINGTAGR